MPWYANIIVPAGSLHAEEYIEQAMNLLPPSGGRVVLMEGEYVISSLINIAGNVILEGQGDSTVIRFISQEETAQAEYWGMGSMIENAFWYTGGKIQVKNLVLDGNDRNGGPDVETFGIRLKGCPCLIENVTVKDVAHMYDSYYVNIWYNEGNECILRNVNIINEEYGDGVGINVTDSQSVTIDSCNVVGCNEAIKVENSRNVIISNNVISSSYVAIDVAYADHISVVNNQIRDCYVNGVSFHRGPVSRSSIVDNIIEEIGEDAIYLANSDDNIISGNVITGAGTRSDDSHNGITIFLSSRNNIQDNIIRFGQHVNKPKYGIAITDWVSEYNLVTNNDLMNSGKSGGFYDNGTYTETTAGNRV